MRLAQILQLLKHSLWDFRLLGRSPRPDLSSGWEWRVRFPVRNLRSNFPYQNLRRFASRSGQLSGNCTLRTGLEICQRMLFLRLAKDFFTVRSFQRVPDNHAALLVRSAVDVANVGAAHRLMWHVSPFRLHNVGKRLSIAGLPAARPSSSMHVNPDTDSRILVGWNHCRCTSKWTVIVQINGSFSMKTAEACLERHQPCVNAPRPQAAACHVLRHFMHSAVAPPVVTCRFCLWSCQPPQSQRRARVSPQTVPQILRPPVAADVV